MSRAPWRALLTHRAIVLLAVSDRVYPTELVRLPGFGGAAMHLSNESLLVILFVGLVAGWLAGQIVRGAGFGLIGDLVIGIIGAFIGDWLLPQIGIHLGTGIVSAIINAAIGAILLLLVIGLLRGRFGGGWSGGWGGRRWW
jgi:uncharacterized membrane protein YeaQ/YmgE (transglycosylase-associated protein family)